MPGFSTLSLQAIEAFAHDIGVTAQPAADGSYTFEFSRSGTLSFVSSDDGDRVIVSMARMPHMPSAEAERKCLMQAGFDPSTSSFLHAGLTDDGLLVVSTSIDDTAFDLSAIDETFLRLSAALDRVGAT